MRDPQRIEPYCDILKSLWQIVPDWRLAQLMDNLLAAWQCEKGYEAFYAEDQDFLYFCSQYLNKITQPT